MKRHVTAAALGAALVASPVLAQDAQVPTAPLASPATAPNQTTETGETELQEQMNDDATQRVVPGAAEIEMEEAVEDQAGLVTGEMEEPEVVEAEDGRIITMEEVDAATGAATDDATTEATQ